MDKGTDKNTITVLTFGIDASQHMYNELVDRKGKFQIKPEDLPDISTMHSLGLKIVMDKPREVKLRKADLKVQDDENVKRLMYRDAALMLGFTEENGEEARECKQCGDCEEKTEEKKCKICSKYWEIMSKCNHIDFDDQILFACQILERNPDLLEKHQSRAKHLLVDEYQDINAAQFKLIELLSRDSRNGLFVVGDDAQSIYAFRGADPKFILHFSEDFPGAETPPLSHSRRCHEKIMNDAVKVLDKYYINWAGRQELEFHVESFEQPYVWQLPSEISEADMVARAARYFINEKKTVLILAPKKAFFPLISKELSKHNVPHECTVNLLPEQVNRRIGVAKLFIEWVANSSDSFITRLVVEELINNGIAKVPGAKKGKTCKPETIDKRISEETKIAKLWESVDRNNDLYTVINRIETQNKTLMRIRDGLYSLMNSYNEFTRDNRGEFARQLSVVTGIWIDPSNLAEDISSVVKLLESQRPMGPGSVQLMTMRKAKGLEADVVMIVGLEDDIIPNPIGDVVEEARLFYVSMTRAKERLYLFHAFKRPRDISYGQELSDKQRSRFLEAIDRPSEFKKPKQKKA